VDIKNTIWLKTKEISIDKNIEFSRNYLTLTILNHSFLFFKNTLFPTKTFSVFPSF